MKDYWDFSSADFAKDESFQNWVLGQREEDRLFWEKWLNDNPEKKKEVDEARKLLLSIDFDRPQLPDGNVEAIWSNIYEKTGGDSHLNSSRYRLKWIRHRRVAAAIIGFLLVFSALAWWYQTREQLITVYTAFGESKKLVLPDRSIVVLNGNSVLCYSPRDFSRDKREVKLEGEAFFSVSHSKEPANFRINAGSDMQVEVLGTTFTMTHRAKKNQVVLADGKVKVTHAETQLKDLDNSIVMLPGDLLEWDKNGGHWQKEKVEDPNAFGAFRNHMLVFRNTRLSEIARGLEDNYGYQVVFASPGLGQKNFTGSCGAGDIDMLLHAIGKAFSLQVRKEKNTIWIGPYN